MLYEKLRQLENNIMASDHDSPFNLEKSGILITKYRLFLRSYYGKYVDANASNQLRFFLKKAEQLKVKCLDATDGAIQTSDWNLMSSSIRNANRVSFEINYSVEENFEKNLCREIEKNLEIPFTPLHSRINSLPLTRFSVAQIAEFDRITNHLHLKYHDFIISNWEHLQYLNGLPRVSYSVDDKMLYDKLCDLEDEIMVHESSYSGAPNFAKAFLIREKYRLFLRDLYGEGGLDKLGSSRVFLIVKKMERLKAKYLGATIVARELCEWELMFKCLRVMSEISFQINYSAKDDFIARRVWKIENEQNEL
jgi:hypothetical protein